MYFRTERQRTKSDSGTQTDKVRKDVNINPRFYPVPERKAKVPSDVSSIHDTPNNKWSF